MIKLDSKSVWKTNSYAKINLGLNVLRRLENGYHEIETGFVFIEWYDEITVKPAKSLQIEYNHLGLNADKNSLVHKAVNLLQQSGYQLPSVEISIKKKIPLGAGLGGGSSNAATTLKLMNQIGELGISQQELERLGAHLGADVPVFLKQKPCFATGIGTTLQPVDIQPDLWIVTAYPNISSSTQEAYQFCEPNSDRDFDLLSELKLKEYDEWHYLIENDLEKSVFPQHQIIGDFKDQMIDFGAVYAAMSGSGSCVFGLFEQDFVALSAYEAFLSLNYPTSLTKPNFKPDFTIYSLI